MPDIKLEPCCQSSFKAMQKVVQLSKDGEKFPQMVAIFGKTAKGPVKIGSKFYEEMTKAVTSGGIKLANRRALKAIAEQEVGNHPNGPLADFWSKMAGL